MSAPSSAAEPSSRSRLVRSPNDLIAGLFLLFCAWLAWQYGQNLKIGTAFRMGPGYIPRMLTWIVLVFGAVLVLRSFRLAGPALERWPVRPFVLVIGSMVLFSQVIEHGGLAIASLLVVLLAAMGSKEGRFREAAILATALAVGACLLFPVLLNLPLRIWPK